MGRGLSCTNGQLVVLITLRFGVAGELSAGVVTVGANRLLELSVEVAAL